MSDHHASPSGRLTTKRVLMVAFALLSIPVLITVTGVACITVGASGGGNFGKISSSLDGAI